MRITYRNLGILVLVLVILCSLVTMVVTQAGAVASPSIVLAPTQGPIGSLVTIDTTGFTPNAPLSVTFGGIAMPVTVWTDSGGSATFTITVPPVAPGAYLVAVTDGVLVSYATFTVVAPTLTVSPSVGRNNTDFILTGSGFAPGSVATITVTNDKKDTNAIGALNVQPDCTLSFAFEDRPKFFARGENTITVQNNFGGTASVVFTLVNKLP
jgi:hypothetical protein